MEKYEYKFKAALLFLAIIFISLQNTIWLHKITDLAFKLSLDMASTKQNIGSFDIVITGGSNAVMGISSEQISRMTGKPSYNLSITPSEGEGFMVYPDWIESLNISAKIVIYSSMNFWYLNKDLASELKPYSKTITMFPIKTPIIRYISILINNKNKPIINKFGDITFPSCDPIITPLSTNHVTTDSLDKAMLDKLINTIAILKLALSASTIYLRIPPILISEENELDFNVYIESISAILEKNGVIVIGKHHALTKDQHKMCTGAIHPTPSGRNEYTKFLLDEMPKI